MLMTDLIDKKRSGEELTTEEIRFLINDYVSGKIADYQMSALCMAIASMYPSTTMRLLDFSFFAKFIA